MNANRLLAHYEQIADAPDAIARLRRFILDLAVLGKLVPQDAADEPAWELLKRLEHERTRRERLKSIKRLALSYEPIALDTDFDLPPKWVKATLGETCDLQTGATPDRNRSEFFGGNIRWLVSGDINRGEIFECEGRITEVGLASSNCKVLPENCVLIALNGQGKTRATVALLRMRAACNQSLVAIIPLLGSDLTPEYVHLSLKARYVAIRELTGKDDRRGLNMRLLECFEIAIPPLAEQRRIVAKVDELMVLCDRLAAARGSREAVRDRLAAASLARLNAPDPQTFQEDARFALDALPALTTRPDQIKRLRQTVFNLALRGKLVPQDPTDEPASELLKRIAKEIAAYAKANRIGQTQAEPIPTDDLPFSAPHGWQWTRLCALFKVVTDGDHQPPPKADEGVAFLTIGNITTGRLDFTGCRMVPETYFKSLAPYRTPAKGDVLYTVVGATYGRPAVVETDRDFCVQRHIAILKPAEAISLRFLVTLLASPLIYDQATRSTTGTAQPTIALRPLRNFLAPLPPLAEQHRIVAKVDALMALCDRLEASLTSTTATRRCLLDALLAEALAPREAREI
jgi:type I restriction enzyme S subunit